MARATPQTLVPFVDLRRQHAPLAEELRGAFERVVGASSFILGEEVEAFERDFAQFCGVDHCVGVGSGTAALAIMLEASGIGRGDEVIVPAHTFIATALAVVKVGAQPVCVDVDPGTGLIDAAAVTAAIGPRTAALLPVHLYGQVASMDELRSLAQRNGLTLFEDAAQAHGSTYRGTRAGSLGSAAAFSFYPSKNLGALGDGGAICTDDRELAHQARAIRDLGRARTGEHVTRGYNERLDGLQAAFLRVKLPRLEVWNEARRTAAARYREALTDLECLEERTDTPCTYHVFPVKLAERDSVAESLRQQGIATGIHYPEALPDQPALPVLSGYEAPVARDWAARELSLPMFPELSDGEIDAVLEALKAANRRNCRAFGTDIDLL
jgi:dTDP-3-amino-3,4,6-trideoxy-alpha-D-glucose transaminase